MWNMRSIFLYNPFRYISAERWLLLWKPQQSVPTNRRAGSEFYTCYLSSWWTGGARRLLCVYCFNNIDVTSLIQLLHCVILVLMSVFSYNLRLLNPKSIFDQISADSSPGMINLLSCSYQMKAMLPRATILGKQGLICSRASNLRVPATGTSQRAQTTLFCFLRWQSRLDINPRSTGRPVPASAGSRVVTTGATTTSTGAASTWWTSTPSGTGWSAWCAAAHWPP